MTRKIRWIRPKKLVEVTCRTVQGRFLLRPSPELKRRVIGALGRAQSLTGLEIHAFVFTSNHYHLLASPKSPKQLVDFMRHIQSNIAREAGDLHDWRDKFWARRYRDIPVSDEPEAQIDRLRYCLAHGVKEKLVARCADWPGASSTRALLEGGPLRGVWYDRTALYEARRRKGGARLRDFASVEEVQLSPLPCWQHLEPDEIRARIADMVRGIDHEHHLDRTARSEGVSGAKSVRERHSHDRPEEPKRSPAPRFHTASQEAWLEMREALQIFTEAFRVAADLLKAGRASPRFPPGSFPPNLPYVPALVPG